MLHTSVRECPACHAIRQFSTREAINNPGVYKQYPSSAVFAWLISTNNGHYMLLDKWGKPGDDPLCYGSVVKNNLVWVKATSSLTVTYSNDAG